MKSLGMKSFTLGLLVLLDLVGLAFLAESFYWDILYFGNYSLFGVTFFVLFYLFAGWFLIFVLFRLFKKMDEIQREFDGGYSESGVELDIDKRGDPSWE